MLFSAFHSRNNWNKVPQLRLDFQKRRVDLRKSLENILQYCCLFAFHLRNNWNKVPNYAQVFKKGTWRAFLFDWGDVGKILEKNSHNVSFSLFIHAIIESPQIPFFLEKKKQRRIRGRINQGNKGFFVCNGSFFQMPQRLQENNKCYEVLIVFLYF